VKIALLCGAFRSLGGVQEIVDHLAVEFSNLAHTVVVVSTPYIASGSERAPQFRECVYLPIDGCKPVSWRHPERLLKLSPMGPLRDFLCRWRPQIVNSHLWEWDKFPTAAKACRAAEVPFVLSLYDSWGRGRFGEQALSALNQADALTALSFATRDYFKSLWPGAARARVIPGAVDIAAADAASAYRRARPYIFCVARLDLRQKALDVMLLAFKRIAAQFPDLDLLIAGDGPDHERLKMQARSLELDGRVEFLGVQPHHDHLWSYYKGALLLAMPSRLPEGLGLVFLESMACGRPVIGSRAGGVPEVILEGETGLMIEHNDPEELATALRVLVANVDQREAMGKRARQIVGERFRWRRVAQDFLEVYAACTPALTAGSE
jgi:glycosyltransferase involved in cell wall biosynthesis